MPDKVRDNSRRTYSLTMSAACDMGIILALPLGYQSSSMKPSSII